MIKRDFFLYSIHNDHYLNRGWLEIVFSVMVENSPEAHLHNYGVYFKDKKLYGSVNGKVEIISDFEYGKPLYLPQEQMYINAHELKCVKHDIITSYGIALMNVLYIERPYEGKINFVNSDKGQPISAKTFNAIARDALVSGKVTIEEHKRFENTPGYTTCLAECSIVSATEKSLIVNPENAILKKKLLEEYKDQLGDPAKIAEIQFKLEDLDREFLKGDESEYFLSLGKARASRTRVFNIYGSEQDYFDSSKTVLMHNSLSEGFGLSDIPMMANSIREGSRARAVSTANGGAKVKETGRIFQNYSIVGEDCKTKTGINRRINDNNYQQYIGRYLVDSNTPMDKEELKSYIGKEVLIRSPQWCRSTLFTVCPRCMGDVVVSTKLGITALANSFTSTLMSIDMAAMHRAGLTIAKYNYKDRII